MQPITLLTPSPDLSSTPKKHLAWTVIFTPRGLQHLSVCFRPEVMPKSHESTLDPRAKTLHQKLLARMAGRAAELSWNELDLTDAPEFHQRVWRELMDIPFGQTRTYGSIAKSVGSPKAFRACGQACGKNRILLFIPCHRVVAARGLGGFSGGLDLKKLLLLTEQCIVHNA